MGSDDTIDQLLDPFTGCRYSKLYKRQTAKKDHFENNDVPTSSFMHY